MSEWKNMEKLIFTEFDSNSPLGFCAQFLKTLTEAHLANGPWNKSLNFIFPT